MDETHHRPAAYRLAEADSVYLRLHAHQPVAWWPWGEAAFDAARERDVPVLLSVGYATCHWCHVMARESFDDPAIATLVNENFVPVKVDREARPDVDAVYMAALQALAGGGGWPMTLALTPAGEPWFAGTYYPPTDRPGMPSFRRVLDALIVAWRDRRDEVARAAAEVRAALGSLERGAATAQRPRSPTARARGGIEVPATEPDRRPSGRLAAFEGRVLEGLEATFDAEHGGFGGAPKFPPHASLRWLEAIPGERAARLRQRTLRALVDGGVTDQLGGALHRYAVDAAWAVPHFEVMLVDQAQMLPRLARAAAETGDARLAWGARAMLEALERDLARPDGLFATGLDAEAAGIEGAFHTWTPTEVAAVVQEPELVELALATFAVRQPGNLDGRSVLAWRGEAEDARVAQVRSRLLEARTARPAPRRDEPAVTAYVGMTIEGLATAARWFEPPLADRALGLATRAADAVWERAWDGRRVRRLADARSASLDADVALLDDQARLGLGLWALHRATGERRQLLRALDLADAVARDFALPEGGFATVPLDRPAPLVRARDTLDGAVPAAEGVAVELLARAAVATGRDDLRAAAEAALETALAVAGLSPTAVISALLAARVLRGPAIEVAVVGDAEDARAQGLLAAARQTAPDACVVLSSGPDDPLVERLPWLAGRVTQGDRPTAYACADGVCRLPVTEPDALVAELAALGAGDER